MNAHTSGRSPASGVETRLRDIISEQVGIDVDEVTRDSSLWDDLGADSLDVVEIVMVAEEAFGIEIPDDDAEELATFGQLADYVERAIARKKGAA